MTDSNVTLAGGVTVTFAPNATINGTVNYSIISPGASIGYGTLQPNEKYGFKKQQVINFVQNNNEITHHICSRNITLYNDTEQKTSLCINDYSQQTKNTLLQSNTLMKHGLLDSFSKTPLEFKILTKDLVETVKNIDFIMSFSSTDANKYFTSNNINPKAIKIIKFKAPAESTSATTNIQLYASVLDKDDAIEIPVSWLLERKFSDAQVKDSVSTLLFSEVTQDDSRIITGNTEAADTLFSNLFDEVTNTAPLILPSEILYHIGSFIDINNIKLDLSGEVNAE